MLFKIFRKLIIFFLMKREEILINFLDFKNNVGFTSCAQLNHEIINNLIVDVKKTNSI